MAAARARQDWRQGGRRTFGSDTFAGGSKGGQERTPHRLAGASSADCHRLSQLFHWRPFTLIAPGPLDHGARAKTQGRTAAAASGLTWLIAKPHRHNLNHHTLAGSQHRRPGQRPDGAGSVRPAPNLTFPENTTSCCTCRQQIHRVAQCGGSRLALVNRRKQPAVAETSPGSPAFSVRVTMKRQSRPLTRRPARLGINKASQASPGAVGARQQPPPDGGSVDGLRSPDGANCEGRARS